MIEEATQIESKKMYHSISEVAKMTGLEQHVLRYWESEFSKLRPKKNRAGNRQFRDKDIQIIKYIKHLLYNDMYTVQGAKKKLQESGYQEVQGQTNLLTSVSTEPVDSIVKLEAVEAVKEVAKAAIQTPIQANDTKLQNIIDSCMMK